MGLLSDLGIDDSGIEDARRQLEELQQKKRPTAPAAQEPQAFSVTDSFPEEKEQVQQQIQQRTAVQAGKTEAEVRQEESLFGLFKEELKAGAALVQSGAGLSKDGPSAIPPGAKVALGAAQILFSPLTAVGRRLGNETLDQMKQAGFSDTTAAVAATIVDVGINILGPGALAKTVARKAVPGGLKSIGLQGAKYGETKVVNEVSRNPLALREIDDATRTLVDNATHNRNVLFVRNVFEESTKTLQGMGPVGELLGNALKRNRNNIEIEIGKGIDELNKLTKGFSKFENEGLTNLLDLGVPGRGGTVTPRVAAAFRTIRQRLDDIGQRAKDAGLSLTNPLDRSDKVPFQLRENFFPHFLGEKGLVRQQLQPRARQTTIESIFTQENARRLKANKPPITIAEAEKRYRFMVRNVRMKKSSLDYSRVYNLPGFERDPKLALTRYYSEAYTRVRRAEVFGPEGQGIGTVVNMIRGKFGNDAASFAERAARRAMGLEELGAIDNLGEGIGRTVRGIQAGLKLGQAVIANASQTVLTAIEVGPMVTARAVARSVTARGRSDALKSGAILNSALEDMMRGVGAGGEGGAQRFGRFVLRRSGFLAVEKANRAVSANAGILFAEDLFRKVRLNPGHRRVGAWKAHLRKMGVDLDTAVKIGEMSEDDLLRSAQSIVNRTQFRIDSTELPLMWTSVYGKTAMQFKSFGFKAGQMMKDDIAKPAIQYARTGGKLGDIMPLLRAAVLLPMGGVLVQKLRDAVRLGELERSESIVFEILDAYATVGAFGLMFDMFVAPTYGTAGVVSALFGPTASDLVAIFYGGGQLMAGNPVPITKQLIGNVPIAGATLRRQFAKAQRKRRGR